MIVQTFVLTTAEEVPDSARRLARQGQCNQTAGGLGFWVLLVPDPSTSFNCSPAGPPHCSPRIAELIRHRTAGDHHGHAKLHRCRSAGPRPRPRRRRRDRRGLRRVRVDEAWCLRCRRDRPRRPLSDRRGSPRTRRVASPRTTPSAPSSKVAQWSVETFLDANNDGDTPVYWPTGSLEGRDHRGALAGFASQVRLCPLVGTRCRPALAE